MSIERWSWKSRIVIAMLAWLLAMPVMAAAPDEGEEGRHALSRDVTLPGPMLGLAVLRAHPRSDEGGEWVPGSGKVALYERPAHDAEIVETVDPAQLLSEEHDYEMPAALVVARAPGWFGVARWRADGSILRWLPEREVVRFLPLSELLARGTYLTSRWNGRLHAAPEGASMAIPRGAALDEGRPTVEVVGVVQRTSGLWLELEIFDRRHCDGERGKPLGHAFVPALDAAGRPTIWFRSRGC